MANIMITRRCNLNCRYCFADEYVNEKKDADITLYNFQNILDFIISDGSETKIGLIGGEPTLHPEFGNFLDILIKEKRVENVMIYTNGIKVKDYADKLSNRKFHLLINCNDIKANSLYYRQFMESLDSIFEKMPERVILGSNFYKPGYDYQYILELLKKYPCRRLRVSISVPNTKGYDYEPLEYFMKMKPEVISFFRKLREMGTIPFFDCNVLPSCVVSAAEMREFGEWGDDNPFSIIKRRQTGCTPVIDILPDYTAVRCFGLSEYTKVNLKEFAGISDLRNYYLRVIDAYAVNSVYNVQCASCYKYKTMKCAGGCLVYKIGQILGKREGMQYGDP